MEILADSPRHPLEDDKKRRFPVSSEKKHLEAACASCALAPENQACRNPNGTGPKGCPTLRRKELLAKAKAEYRKPEIGAFAKQASIQEAACYANRHERPYIPQPSKTRMEEICEFAHRMNYQRLGLVFCAGLKKEAAIVEEILRNNGFEIVSVICKAGRTPKESIGIEDQDKVCRGTDESMCNPIFQAMVVNEAQTDFNVLLGLCVGHDSLFLKYAEAFTTVLAAKDRVTGHNPLAPIYLNDHYYRKLKRPPAGAGDAPLIQEDKKPGGSD
jgi:uncharacterized metal-binding protein